MADLTAMMQAAAGNAGGDANFIEDMFSCFLYTGNGSTQTINNGIDLAGKGGLVWIKNRDAQAFGQNYLMDTVRGIAGGWLSSNLTSAQSGDPGNLITAYNADGFTEGGTQRINASGTTYVSWTFRKQPKFFDVVTYTGTGANRTVAHGLGSVPGAIWVKRTDASADWQCYHRSLANTQYMVLNSTAAVATGATRWNSTTPTDAVFSLGTDSTVNVSGGTYVAYLFAHDAGGFGLSGEDNVISCGSYTGSSSSDVTINLGYEVQFVMVKNITTAANWQILDVMRGMPLSGNARTLAPNLADQESGLSAPVIVPTATGMTIAAGLGTSLNTDGSNYIYIAIRRGPMKVPETGTSVFSPAIRTGTGTTATVTGVGFPLDVVITNTRNYPGGAGHVGQFWDRLRGAGRFLRTPFTDAEGTVANAGVLGQDGYTVSNSSGGQNGNGEPFVDYSFRRAPGFFDEVCYTGNDALRAVTHNLTVTPQLVIVKLRSAASEPWVVWSAFGTQIASMACGLNSTNPYQSLGQSLWNDDPDGTPSMTSTTFQLGRGTSVNANGQTYVAYLFASCPGVSKVGSYTGTGTTQVINCGFTAGSRFIMIKRTDSTGSWYVWDSARGIVAGNDPYLLLNSTAAEVTNTDFVDTAATGFEISSTAPAEINASGGTFIFFAVS